MSALLGTRSVLGRDILSHASRVNAQLVHTYSLDMYFTERTTPKRFKDIPGPVAPPVVGNIWKYYLGRQPLETVPFTYEGYLKEYGPLVKEHLFFGRTLVHVFNPLDMHKIYSLDRTYFPHRISRRPMDRYLGSRLNMFVNAVSGSSLSSKEQWSEIQRTFEHKFLRESNELEFEQVTDDLVERIRSKISAKKGGDVALLPMLYDWSFECMGVLALGKRLGCLDSNPDERLGQFLRCIHDSQEAVFHTENLPRLFTGKHNKKLVHAQEFLYLFLKSHVREVMAQYMYSSYDENYELENDSKSVERMSKSVAWSLASKNLEERDVMTMIIDMCQGGIYSTAHALAFALYHLAMNPAEQKKIRSSLIKQFPNPQDCISAKPVDQKVQNAIAETLRLNPATIGTGRVLPESLLLSGYQVPKGTKCILHHQIASKQREYFENPDAFIPSRYNYQNLTNAQIFANSPFALGRGSCPGKNIALTEISIGLSKILRNFEVSYNYEKVGTKICLINEPDRPINMTFTPTTA